jgi:signal transduction histidine kinase
LWLVLLLGIKAYSVARTHFAEMSELSMHDVKAQALLVKIEGLASQRENARRKFSITHDIEYKELVSHYDELIDEARGELADTLGSDAKDSNLKSTGENASALREKLRIRREQKIAHAHSAAQGLLRLILLALILSGVITAWLFTLFYRGLLDPLRKLTDATARIRGGDLAYRLGGDAERGVTELRELARSFDQMAERLEHLDAAKKEFLATVSHEIKNPLAALKEGLTLISSQGDTMLPNARSRAFSACLIASKRLESMINNLLHHSRMDMGLFAFDLTPKDLTGAILTAKEEVRPLAQKKGMTIQYRGDPEIMAAFNWDGMVQVFENLLLNAIKYGNENSVIEIHAHMKDRQAFESEGVDPTVPRIPHLELAVINDGARLKDEDLTQAFDRFYRGSNSKQQQGMGLGLHVVKRIVEAHHGGITAASEAGKTRFELWIPGRYETEAG